MHTRSYGAEFTVVISPSAQPRIADLRHAYLYYVLDPLATRNREILERKKPLADHAMRAALLGDAYKQDFLLLVTGSLVRAVEARMDNKRDADQALKEGYILAPYFFEALAAYEKQDASMALYYTSMVQAIDLLKEDKRLLPVIFAEKTAVPADAAPPDPKAVTPPIYESLNKAEELLKNHKLDQAEEIFQEAANQTANKRAAAAGYYGLARIALAQGEHEDGETLLEKSLELEPEGQIKARVLIDLGQLRLEVMDYERAAKYFQQALHVDGATEAAHAEAMQGLDKSLQKVKKN
jgi:tetratricopeptide (TPR) repeat protein